MFRERINKLGKEQIQVAHKIIISNDNPYFVAKFGNKQSRFSPDPYIAIVVYENGANSLVSAGNDLGHWRFLNLKNGIKSIRRINKNVPIHVYSEEEITKFVVTEKAENQAFLEAARKFNAGEKKDLIEILKESNPC